MLDSFFYNNENKQLLKKASFSSLELTLLFPSTPYPRPPRRRAPPSRRRPGESLRRAPDDLPPQG